MGVVKIMLVAGEASGDLHGAHLAQALKSKEPQIQLIGIGGSLMAQAGVELLYDPTEMSAIGFAEVIKSAIVLKRVLSRMSAVLDRQRPDTLVLIDFPEFNMRLADLAKARDIPVVYYFSPSAWAWRRRRAKVVAGHATKVCAVLPFEADVYREAGAPVEYVGHPLVDVAKPSAPRDVLREQFGCEAAVPVIGLLPGSRRQEIDHHLQTMVQLIEKMVSRYRNVSFLVGLAHTVPPEWVRPIQEKPGVNIVQGRPYDVLHAADAAVCAMGTVTLEAALVGCPIVGMYRTSPSTYWIARRLYQGKYVALPNIIAGREIVPELLQEEVSVDNVMAALTDVLDPGRQDEIRQGYASVRDLLGGPGAVGRAADVVLRVAESGAKR